MARHRPRLAAKQRADQISTIKIRQLQQYLHGPGRIPAGAHPFVKQAIEQASPQSSASLGGQPKRGGDRLPHQALSQAIAALFQLAKGRPYQWIFRLLPNLFRPDDHHHP
ncbi:hypothetical protein [Picosynechococcus sp. NKBG15041c]|uniref:hypothetical protein n=1 Tax=Picosynechococcus sp. NKBG15041c TaxID=1407650 RepID=UPI00040F953B|nr:hypothetical protein [Picosynechococcus sp. NKBG15041c]